MYKWCRLCVCCVLYCPYRAPNVPTCRPKPKLPCGDSHPFKECSIFYWSRMKRMVSVPCTLSATPCASLPNSFAADSCQIFLNRGSFSSCQYSSCLPVSGSVMALSSCTGICMSTVPSVSAWLTVCLLLIVIGWLLTLFSTPGARGSST